MGSIVFAFGYMDGLSLCVGLESRCVHALQASGAQLVVTGTVEQPVFLYHVGAAG